MPVFGARRAEVRSAHTETSRSNQIRVSLRGETFDGGMLWPFERTKELQRTDGGEGNACVWSLVRLAGSNALRKRCCVHVGKQPLCCCFFCFFFSKGDGPSKTLAVIGRSFWVKIKACCFSANANSASAALAVGC